MGWIDLLDDSRSLMGIFKEKVPSLTSSTLHEIELQRDGPLLRLRIDLNDFPEDPPREWKEGRFDTVQIELELSAVANAEIIGISNRSIVDLDISTVATDGVNSIRVRTSGSSSSRIDAIGGRLNVSSLSAYQVGGGGVDCM
ncbi:Imm50 family immunity protein [Nocardia sp. NPDC056064]|uniref:Imm50 family immunity protein n=1 Tax=Nocardia sp. NPDC056064 TaxID=3345701 RepID=UPI0035DB6D93